MKKFKSCAVLFIGAVMTLNVLSVSAFKAEADNSLKTVTISGESEAAKKVTVMITAPHYTAAEVTEENAEDTLICIEQTDVIKNGSVSAYDLVYNLGSDCRSGIYTVYVSESGNREEATFEIRNEQRRNTAETLIKNGSNIKDVLDEYADDLSIDAGNIYFGLTADEKKIVAKRIDTKNDIVYEFTNQCERIEDIKYFCEGFKEGTIERLTSDAAVLGIGAVVMNKFNSLSAAKKEACALAFCKKLSAADVPAECNLEKLLEESIPASTDSGNNTGTAGGTRGGGGGGGISAPAQGFNENNKPMESEEVSTGVFSDLAGYEWAEPAITALVKKGILNGKGDGKFCPGDYITREEFVKILCLAYEIPESTAKIGLKDADPEAWYFPYVSGAFNAGYVRGVAGDMFGVGQNILRQDMALMIYRVMEADPLLEMYEAGGNPNFADWDSVSNYAKDAIEKMAKCRLIKGNENGEFKPLDNTTRAEAAQFVYNTVFK